MYMYIYILQHINKSSSIKNEINVRNEKHLQIFVTFTLLKSHSNQTFKTKKNVHKELLKTLGLLFLN